MRSRHSDLADSTNRAANAFKLGLHAGRTSGVTPLSLSARFHNYDDVLCLYSASRCGTFLLATDDAWCRDEALFSLRSLAANG